MQLTFKMTFYITEIKNKEFLFHASIHLLFIKYNDNLNLHIAFLWLTDIWCID